MRRIYPLLSLICAIMLIPCAVLAEDRPYTDVRSLFPSEEGEAKKVLISFIGDVTLGANERDHGDLRSMEAYIEQNGFSYPFERVSYILSQDDLTVANLEGTLHSDSTGLTAETKKAYNFRADPSYVEVLKQASIEAVALGNNHSGDYGEPGFTETVQVLDGSGIGWFGDTAYSSKGYIFETNGVKIGFVGCYQSYWVYNNGMHVPQINATIEAVRAQDPDVLIVYMHSGVEYQVKHDKRQEPLVNYYVKRGADIVMSSHPHRLQGVQLWEGVPVFYSLGNFVFGGNFRFYNPRRDKRIAYTAIVLCALSFDENDKYLGCRFNIIPCRLGEDSDKNEYQPFVASGADAQAALKEMQTDTLKSWRLRDHVEGVGAMQDFIPAVKRDEP